MVGDPLQKLVPGDGIPTSVRTWNPMLEAARLVQNMRTGGYGQWGGKQASVLVATNSSGATVPIYGVASVAAVSDPGVGTLGAVSDAPYAIALQEIADGAAGPVAVAGGPWKVSVSGTVACGDRLEPTAGQTYCEVVGTGVLEALSADDGGYCWAVFAPGAGGQVMVTTNDASLDYLAAKLEAGTHIALSTQADGGGNQTVKIDESGTRMDSTQRLRVEVRSSAPSSPLAGQIWLRSDL